MRNKLVKRFLGVLAALSIAAMSFPGPDVCAAQPGPVIVLSDGTVSDMSSSQNVIVVSINRMEF